ncbi:hypothetical protein [Candidatus Nephthysia bennettiae]|uniref:Uncharacterized protein n=1 Tax=Candidatus Nephthysia bennettiae TaxID=3127016 RepID=A0A934JX11_9BACT|nr:hypothetical protein [Candidatus Dormibacteraeota bacterium]
MSGLYSSTGVRKVREEGRQHNVRPDLRYLPAPGRRIKGELRERKLQLQPACELCMFEDDDDESQRSVPCEVWQIVQRFAADRPITAMDDLLALCAIHSRRRLARAQRRATKR